MHRMEYCSTINRNDTIDIFKYTDESQTSCAKSNKANLKGDRQHDSTYITFMTRKNIEGEDTSALGLELGSK